MTKYSEIELNLINIQIGCVIRLARLKRNLSQHELSLIIGTNPTMVGRVERFENESSWNKIYCISQQLEINFFDLFVLKSKEELLNIVDESLSLEEKLTTVKRDYYFTLRSTITAKFNSLSKD
ncbi:helix-turn-helix domain-containing protein [Aequorivita capsosiphonis]|uniref:helix-turn-helix domain-containing protein n=1 Tax=Aequorivita capsosiphonis TaxID=487317 RepID=UPI00047CC588|nr:helix-turn-helix transcriptional regulator [Aequorivita capsosiphonis]